MSSLIDKSDNQFQAQLTSTGTTNWIVLDVNLLPWQASAHVALTDSPNLTYTVEAIFEYPASLTDSSIPVYRLENMKDLTVDEARGIPVPVAAIRLNVTAYTSGTATLRVLQAGNRNSARSSR